MPCPPVQYKNGFFVSLHNSLLIPFIQPVISGLYVGLFHAIEVHTGHGLYFVYPLLGVPYAL